LKRFSQIPAAKQIAQTVAAGIKVASKFPVSFNLHLSKFPGRRLNEKRFGFGLVFLFSFRAAGTRDSDDGRGNLVAHVKVSVVSNQDELRLLTNRGNQRRGDEFRQQMRQQRFSVKRSLKLRRADGGSATEFKRLAPLVRHENCPAIRFAIVEFAIAEKTDS